MADSHAVDRAQAAGFTVASTTGVVTGPLSAGALHRLQRIVETAGGRLEYTDASEAVAEVVKFGTTAGKGIRFYAKAGSGTAGNAKKIVVEVPVDDNQAHALAVSDDETTVTVSLQVDTDGSTILSTAADVVAAVNSHDDEVLAELYDVAATQEALARLTFEDVAESGDDLILTGKSGADLFSCTIRRPKTKGPEADDTAVSVNMLSRNHIEVVVPATKTVANVKSAIEAHTDANALVTVTTAGTTTHAVVCDEKLYEQSSFANRGSALMTTFTSADLAGGAAAAIALRVVPAVA